MNDGDIVHFLMVYDLDAQQLIETKDFSDVDDAVQAYFEMEREFLRRRDRYEVVLVGSDSIETVMQTHASYFDRDVSRTTDLSSSIDDLLKLVAKATTSAPGSRPARSIADWVAGIDPLPEA